MKPRHAVEQAMFERVVILEAGAVFGKADAKAAGLQKLGQARLRVVIEMMRQGERKPVLAKMTGLVACEIRQTDQHHAAGTKKAPGLLEDGARIGQMLER